MEPDRQPTDQLIVVGSSAGGVEALSVLVASLPADLMVPIVIAQHLAPGRPSALGEILARRSPLPVRTVEDQEALQPGAVYVVPSNRHVTITDHEVSVHPDRDRRPTPSVDLLLATAAGVFEERLIAVILTGGGSDGSAGAYAVKKAGGTVIIQDPATAAFPSMPASLAAPLVDAAVPLEAIGPLLASLVTGVPASSSEADARHLSAILNRLRDRRGIDFSAYKPPTIERRLRRRMAASGVATISDYLSHVAAHPDEEQRLVADFLIKVTSFFRDSALFDHLRDELLPELIRAARTEDRELRIWSAGCATGEEAYSVALLVADLLSDRGDSLPVRIFATDLDPSALSFARRGIYPASALAQAPPQLVERYFEERDGAYEVRKSIRGMLVFGAHDLAQRPPFPQTDLILCRNVLIYFAPELQRRALEIFAYSLRDGGCLVLGKSETPHPVEQLFVDVDRQLRIFRRAGARRTLPPPRLPRLGPPLLASSSVAPRTPSALEFALQQNDVDRREPVASRSEDMVRRLPIGIAVVNRTYDIELINGVGRDLLGIHGIATGQDLIHLARRTPSAVLRDAIDAVVKGEPLPATKSIVGVTIANGEERQISISCLPDRVDDSGVVETVLVIVQDATPLVQSRRSAAETEARSALLADTNRRLLAANRELTDSIDRLREQGEELRRSTAASQVSSEEIETLNEELQSTNEELETLNEEAQSTVEELNVANEELQARAVELEEMAVTQSTERNQLAAILASIAEPVVVVNRAGHPVRTNAAYDELLQLLGDTYVPVDEVGAPLPMTETLQARAARGESFRIEFTAVAKTPETGRRWFEATGRPLAGDDLGAGVVVIRDISDRSVRRLQEEFLSWAGHELRTPLTALQGFLQMADRRIGPDGDPRLRSYLSSAIEQVRREGVLIKELLDATRLESGRLSLTMKPLDLNDLAAEACAVAEALAKGQRINLIRCDAPVMISGDAGRLQQAVLNLLTNAIDYAPDTDRIDIVVARDGQDATLAVRDFGRGIASAKTGVIFDRFTRGESAEQIRGDGLGLGLYITREIVRAHEGDITVESSLGIGTTFTIHLPVAEGPHDSQSAES